MLLGEISYYVISYDRNGMNEKVRRQIFMDKKKRNTLLTIAGAGLAVAGIIFLCISIFGETKSNWALGFALGCVALSNVFNIIRSSLNRKEE